MNSEKPESDPDPEEQTISDRAQYVIGTIISIVLVLGYLFVTDSL